MNKEKRLHSDERAQYWLAEANIRIESKQSDERIAEAERKAQYWLDRLNHIEGNNT